MRRYKLTAATASYADIPVYIDAAEDFDATMQAISTVIAKATKSNTWAKGRVVLSEGARIVHVMEAK
jgi:hypothetical protein